MSDGDKATLGLISGILVGTIVGGACVSLYNRFSKRGQYITIPIEGNPELSEDNSGNLQSINNNSDSDIKHENNDIDNTNNNTGSVTIINNEEKDNHEIQSTLISESILSQLEIKTSNPITTNQEDVLDVKVRTNKTEKIKKYLRITEIDKSPLELRKRFDNKGYVFITHNLATVNTELNELVELMRKNDLHILNGCKDPSSCSCNFRHKLCRLFMVRKHSYSSELQFFAPSCTGVTDISPSNTDIKNGTPIHEYVQLFQNKFSDRVMDLVNYINFIIDPKKHSPYVVDVTLIADPCAYVGPFYVDHKNINKNINNNVIMDEDINPIIQLNTDINISDKGKIVIDTKLARNNKCTIKWSQARFVEARTNKIIMYDYIAMFVLGSSNVTPHKLMIGKIKDDVDISKMLPEEIQENAVLLADTWINPDNNSDIGYIVDQTKGYLHKHSDFEYINEDAIRNVITIRIKYLN